MFQLICMGKRLNVWEYPFIFYFVLQVFVGRWAHISLSQLFFSLLRTRRNLCCHLNV